MTTFSLYEYLLCGTSFASVVQPQQLGFFSIASSSWGLSVMSCVRNVSPCLHSISISTAAAILITLSAHSPIPSLFSYFVCLRRVRHNRPFALASVSCPSWSACKTRRPANHEGSTNDGVKSNQNISQHITTKNYFHHSAAIPAPATGARRE